jgi:hypothetical protein
MHLCLATANTSFKNHGYSYGNDITHKNSILRAENTCFGMFILKKIIGWRGLDPFRDR